MEAITLEQIKSRHLHLGHGTSGIIYPSGTAELVALEAHVDRHKLLEAVESYRSLIVKLEGEIARLKESLPVVEWNGKYVIKPTHEAANAFWKHWKENGETHKHGYYESTWGAINAALKA